MDSTLSLPNDRDVSEEDTQKIATIRTTQNILSHQRFSLTWGEWISLGLLTLAALIPRLILALQLDIFTDEPIYIMAGKGYVWHGLQLNFTSADWLYNNEHPAFAKTLMGLSIALLHAFGISNTLFAARLPSVLLGTALVAGVYLLARAPFGRTVALLAAFSLAFSPWVAYFSGLALLDTTMTALITLAYLLLWHSLSHPRLYALCGILIGLAGASKYPAALVVPAFLVFIVYYYALLRRKLPAEQKAPLPWRWWLIGACLIPLSFFLADPPIWLDPIHRLLVSLQFSLGHADNGHVTFWAGQVYTHIPAWMILYVLFGKVSTLITLPALGFLIFACIKLVRFHWPVQSQSSLPHTSAQINAMAGTAFLFIWLILSLICFSQLTILVGTHYYLPVAAPLFLAGASGLTLLGKMLLRRFSTRRAPDRAGVAALSTRQTWQAGLLFALLFLLLVGPNLLGLLTTSDADGYTSEFFAGENNTLEVMYDGYRDADVWLMAHSKTGGTVGIVGGSATVLWYLSNPKAEGQFHFVVTTYGHASYAFDYLVWPMDLIQRTWGPPPPWNTHVVHAIMGGKTIYCLILARDPSSISP